MGSNGGGDVMPDGGNPLCGITEQKNRHYAQCRLSRHADNVKTGQKKYSVDGCKGSCEIRWSRQAAITFPIKALLVSRAQDDVAAIRPTAQDARGGKPPAWCFSIEFRNVALRWRLWGDW